MTLEQSKFFVSNFFQKLFVRNTGIYNAGSQSFPPPKALLADHEPWLMAEPLAGNEHVIHNVDALSTGCAEIPNAPVSLVLKESFKRLLRRIRRSNSTGESSASLFGVAAAIEGDKNFKCQLKMKGSF